MQVKTEQKKEGIVYEAMEGIDECCFISMSLT